MTYIPIDKRCRILGRQGNVIHMATIMQCINDKYPGTTAIASMLTGKIEEYLREFIFYKTDTDSFKNRYYSGTKYTTTVTKLSLVKGKPGNIINMADYCGRLEK